MIGVKVKGQGQDFPKNWLNTKQLATSLMLFHPQTLSYKYKIQILYSAIMTLHIHIHNAFGKLFGIRQNIQHDKRNIL